jgi:hypothetical protein
MPSLGQHDRHQVARPAALLAQPRRDLTRDTVQVLIGHDVVGRDHRRPRAECGGLAGQWVVQQLPRRFGTRLVEPGALIPLGRGQHLERRLPPGCLALREFGQDGLEAREHALHEALREHRVDDVPDHPQAAVAQLPELAVQQDLRSLQHAVGRPVGLAHEQRTADGERAHGAPRRPPHLVERLEDLDPAPIDVLHVGDDLVAQPAGPVVEGLVVPPVDLQWVERGEVAQHLPDLRMHRQPVRHHVVQQEVPRTAPVRDHFRVDRAQHVGRRQSQPACHGLHAFPWFGRKDDVAPLQPRPLAGVRPGDQRQVRRAGPVGNPVAPVLPGRLPQRGLLDVGEGQDAVPVAQLQLRQLLVGVAVQRQHRVEQTAARRRVAEEVVVVVVQAGPPVAVASDVHTQPRPAVQRQLRTAHRGTHALDLPPRFLLGEVTHVGHRHADRRRVPDGFEHHVVPDHHQVRPLAQQGPVQRVLEALRVQLVEVQLHVLVWPDVILETLPAADEERGLQVRGREGAPPAVDVGNDRRQLGRLLVITSLSGQPLDDLRLPSHDRRAQLVGQFPFGGTHFEPVVVDQAELDAGLSQLGQQRCDRRHSVNTSMSSSGVAVSSAITLLTVSC